MKQAIAAAGLTAIMATSASADSLMTEADKCFLNDMFTAASELHPGTHITFTANDQYTFIENCELKTGTNATGFSYGLTKVAIDGASINFAEPN